MNRIYVIGVDMEKRTTEDIARDAVNQINELFEKLIEEYKAESAEKKERES